MIETLLAQLGLQDKEIRVYLMIHQERKMPAARVAELTGIQRSTVYHVAEELIHKGLLEKEVTKHTTYFIAKPLDRLNALLNQEREKIDQQSILVKQAHELIQELPQHKIMSAPKIRIIDEAGFQYFLEEQTPVWETSMIRSNDMTWWGYQEKEFPELFGSWVRTYWKQARKGFSTKLVTNDFTTAEAQKLENLTPVRTFKYWPHAEFTATVWVHGEYIVFFSLNVKPFYAIEIHNPLFAENMRVLFKGVWQMLG